MRKLVIGTKTVGGLPKQKPPRLRFTLEEEDLIVKLYGRYFTEDGVAEEEFVMGTATIPTRVEVRPEKAYWMKTGGPDEIHLIAARDVTVTRVTCTLPLSLQELRPGHEQDLPIAPARILKGNSVTICIPQRLISFG